MNYQTFKANLESYGFQVENTGGGCTAWVAQLFDGRCIVVEQNLSHEIDSDDDISAVVYAKDCFLEESDAWISCDSMEIIWAWIVEQVEEDIATDDSRSNGPWSKA